MNPVLELARPDIRELAPYQHAPWEPALERMHANELPWRAPGDDTHAGLNRYPEPQPRTLLAKLAELYGAEPACMLVGRGSDEAIDLLVRAFCRAGQDRVLICPPTFGMYKVAAAIQGAGVVEVPLLAQSGFALDAEAVLHAWQPGVKLVFLCSPNNPTGNAFPEDALRGLCTALAQRALVAVDEAYIEFSGRASLARHLAAHPNLVVLRTLSKAYGLAGARCGVLIADREIVALLRRIIPPYAIPSLVAETVLELLGDAQQQAAGARIATLGQERARVYARLATLPAIVHCWPSEGNFLLARCASVDRVMRAAASAGLLLRDLSKAPGLAACVRITLGTPEQNDRLLAALARAGEEVA